MPKNNNQKAQYIAYLHAMQGVKNNEILNKQIKAHAAELSDKNQRAMEDKENQTLKRL